VVWGFAPYEPVGRYLVSLLDRLGLDASFKLVPIRDFFTQAADSRRGVQAGAYYWQTDYPAASAMLTVQLSCAAFRPASPGNFNISEFCDPSVERAIRRAQLAAVAEPETAASLWAAVDRRVVDEAPVVPLASMQGVDFVSRRLRNYMHHPIYGVLLDQAWVR
jgi:peptide/nickel transport system substrate-binding protein